MIDLHGHPITSLVLGLSVLLFLGLIVEMIVKQARRRHHDRFCRRDRW